MVWATALKGRPQRNQTNRPSTLNLWNEFTPSSRGVLWTAFDSPPWTGGCRGRCCWFPEESFRKILTRYTGSWSLGTRAPWVASFRRTLPCCQRATCTGSAGTCCWSTWMGSVAVGWATVGQRRQCLSWPPLAPGTWPSAPGVVAAAPPCISCTVADIAAEAPCSVHTALRKSLKKSDKTVLFLEHPMPNGTDSAFVTSPEVSVSDMEIDHHQNLGFKSEWLQVNLLGVEGRGHVKTCSLTSFKIILIFYFDWITWSYIQMYGMWAFRNWRICQCYIIV